MPSKGTKSSERADRCSSLAEIKGSMCHFSHGIPRITSACQSRWAER
jgi:hypothetical protein